MLANTNETGAALSLAAKAQEELLFARRVIRKLRGYAKDSIVAEKHWITDPRELSAYRAAIEDNS